MREKYDLQNTKTVNPPTWYGIDFQGVEEALNCQNQLKTPTRVWAKAGYEKEIVFVDDQGFSIWEHPFSVDGDTRNWVTCLDKQCPFCEAKAVKFYVTFFTVIQTSENWSGDIQYKNKRRLFCAQPDVASILKQIKDNNKGVMVGCKFRVFRGDYSTDATKGTFKLLEWVGVKRFNNPRAFDYESLLQPKSRVELINLLNRPDVNIIRDRTITPF